VKHGHPLLLPRTAATAVQRKAVQQQQRVVLAAAEHHQQRRAVAMCQGAAAGAEELLQGRLLHVPGPLRCRLQPVCQQRCPPGLHRQQPQQRPAAGLRACCLLLV
jgi:hypothetical protein